MEKPLKLIIHGPSDHIFTLTLLESAKNPQNGIKPEICESWENLIARLPSLKSATILLINKNEKEAREIVSRQPLCQLLMCRGGEKEFQPTLTLISPDSDEQRFLFENWEDFISKIKDPPINLKPLFSSTAKANVYRVNYNNFPAASDRQKKMVNKKYFWFQIYFSKLYLRWFSAWAEETMEMHWTPKITLPEKGKQKRLTLPLPNIHKGELIFREGEPIKFLFRDYSFIHGTIISSDEESIDIHFPEFVLRKKLNDTISIHKGENIIERTITTYQKICAGYSDLSEKDYIYQTAEHYNRPEDFLRGFLPNHNALHLPIPTVQLDGPSRSILFDDSQSRALADIIGPSFVSLIEGGPGTGKTLLMAVAIKQLFLQGRIILLSSHSNKGLDNLLETLIDHIGEKRIFRLGNDASLISSTRIKKLHRSHRYEKECKIAEDEWTKKWEKEREEDGKSKKDCPPFGRDNFVLDLENQDLWELIISRKTFILASTINSVIFDRQLSSLYFQNQLILNASLEEFRHNSLKYVSLFGLPHAVVRHLQKDITVCRPSFSIDVTFIDEATKMRLYEIVPLLKKTNYKLVLVGDTDQLGNINPSAEANEEMLNYVYRDCDFYAYNEERKEQFPLINHYLVPKKNQDFDFPLMPIRATGKEILQWQQNFITGIFLPLIQSSNISSEILDVNRRSLEEITKFLNFVFNKKMKVGRFNPYSRGSVIFLDTDGEEKRVRTSYCNDTEKNLVVAEVIKFFQQQLRQNGKINLKTFGAIATYRGQINAIKGKLRKELLFNPVFGGLITPDNIDQTLKELVNTVDAFQGSERETIILSLVRANKDGLVGYSSDLRRIYVALSRARAKLIIFGNAQTFLNCREPIIKKVFGKIIKFTQTNKKYSRKKSAR